jgi:hypothetical protein
MAYDERVAARVRALARPHARKMELTGRPMRGFVTVRPDGLKARALNRWVQEALARAESLSDGVP